MALQWLWVEADGIASIEMIVMRSRTESRSKTVSWLMRTSWYEPVTPSPSPPSSPDYNNTEVKFDKLSPTWVATLLSCRALFPRLGLQWQEDVQTRYDRHYPLCQLSLTNQSLGGLLPLNSSSDVTTVSTEWHLCPHNGESVQHSVLWMIWLTGERISVVFITYLDMSALAKISQNASLCIRL